MAYILLAAIPMVIVALVVNRVHVKDLQLYQFLVLSQLLPIRTKVIL